MCASNNDVMLYKRQAKFLTIRGLGLFLVDHLFKSTFHARARLVKLRSLLKRLETSRIFIFKNQFLQIHTSLFSSKITKCCFFMERRCCSGKGWT